MKSILTFCCLLLFVTTIKANIYPITPPDVPTSKSYEVWVNGQEMFVGETSGRRFGNYAFSTFDFTGSVTIKVKFKNNIRWVDIMPSILKIEHKTLDDHTFEFVLDKPEKITLFTNNDRFNALHIITGRPEKNKPNATDKNVLYYTAGKTYDVGILDLTDNQTLYIEGGAKLRGMVRVRNAKNVKILGRGMIDGSINKQVKGDKENDPFRLIYLENATDVEINGITLFNSLRWTIHPKACTDLRIEKIRIFNWDFGSDGIDLVSCKNVVITDSFLRTNDDCIAIKALSGERDSYYPNPRKENPDVKNIKVNKCVFWNMQYGNVFDIGFELRCNKISDLTFTDCDVLFQEGRGAVFAVHNGDNASVENVVWDNIRIENANQGYGHKLFDLAILYSIWSYDAYERYGAPPKDRYNGVWDNLLPVPEDRREFIASNRGSIKNITFKNIQILDGKFPYSVCNGFDENHLVENITFENIKVNGKKISTKKDLKLSTKFTKNIQFK